MKHPSTRHYLLGAMAIASVATTACGHTTATSVVTSPPAGATTIEAPSVPPSEDSSSLSLDSGSAAATGQNPTPGSASTTITTVTSTASTGSSPSTPSQASGAVRACTSDQIVTDYTPADHGAGQTYIVLRFTNSSQLSCTLQGYPGAAGLNSSGHQLAQAVRTTNGLPTPPPTVLLGPHTVASATIHGSDIGSGSAACPDFASLLVTPPNTTRSVPVTEALASCSFQVYPVVAGTQGSNA
jgi:hypothetical protein